MDACALHGRDGLDRSRQFAFETALVIDLFGELADAEFLVFHQFEADGAAFGQSLRRQTQAHLVNFAAGDEDGAAALAETVGHVHLFEGGDDRAAVAFGNVREQNAVIRLLEPGAASHQQRNDTGNGDHQYDFLLTAQASQDLADALCQIFGCRVSGRLGSGCRHA